MISEERIVALKNQFFVEDRYGESFNFLEFARAIEAEAQKQSVPEGYVLVRHDDLEWMEAELGVQPFEHCAEEAADAHRRIKEALAAAPQPVHECACDEHGACVNCWEGRTGKPVQQPSDVFDGMSYKDLINPVQQPEKAQQEPACPYPCGWKNLFGIIVESGAFLARGLCEDEPITEHQRNEVMRMIGYAQDLCLWGRKQEAPPTEAATWNAALDAAAKVADDKAKRVNSMWIAHDIADGIRALKKEE